MQENPKDYEFCLKVALDNAKKRIKLLDDPDKKCVLNKHIVLLLREDPII